MEGDVIVVDKEGNFNIPKEYQISKENRKCVIKTPFATTIKRLLKGDFQEQNQQIFLTKRRKGFERDIMEINGKVFNVLRLKGSDKISHCLECGNKFISYLSGGLYKPICNKCEEKIKNE